MAITFNSGTAPNIQTFVETIYQMLGQTALDLSHSASFKLELVSLNGTDLTARLSPLDQGANPTKVKITLPSNVVVPTGGPADLDGAYGSAVMANSTVDVTVPAPAFGGDAVPTTALLTAWQTTEGGVVKPLDVYRVDASTIRICSKGKSFVSPIDCDAQLGICVAGTIAVTMNETAAVGDLIHVEEVTAGGAAAGHFSGYRSGASAITVFAHDAAGALVAGNTSTVRITKFPVASTSSKNTATGTLVAGAVDIALANVAGERLVVKAVTAAGTAANHFVAFRKNDTTVTVQAVTAAGGLQTANTSLVRVYNMGLVDCVTGTLVAGTKDILCAVTAGDVMSVKEVTAAGGAAACYSVNRKNATEVTVNAQNAAGALVNTSTSIVRVYNFKTAAVETSTVRWTVIRP
jgi:hypothetical protein